MKSLRFVALKLAALSEADRRWLWRQLSKAEQSRLKPELDLALQLSPVELLAAMEERPFESAATFVQSQEPAEHSGLDRVSGEHLIALLEVLPVSFTALLLERKRASWSDELESALSVDELRSLPEVLLRLRGRVSTQFERLMLDQIAAAADNAGPGARAASESKFDALLGR